MTQPYLPAAIPADLVEGVVGLVNTPSVFCKLHKVQDKDSKRPIPFDPLPSNTASGIRVGTPATTTRGLPSVRPSAARARARDGWTAVNASRSDASMASRARPTCPC